MRKFIVFGPTAYPRPLNRIQQFLTACHLHAAVVVIGILLATPASASEHKSGIGLGFIQMQKLWQGLVEKPRMTTCRLATRQTYKKKQICVYSGANHTLVAIYNSAGAYCNNELRCKYDPDRSKSVAGYVKQFRASQK